MRRTASRPPLNAVGLPGSRYTLQVYVEDCTGCGLCVETCPVTNPLDDARKAINLVDLDPVLEQERDNIGFFETLPQNDRARVDFGTVRGTQFLEPLFEFSGACAAAARRPTSSCRSSSASGHHRQRHRLLLDLRQPADDPMEQERRRPRPGMVQLSSRTTPSSGSACASRRTCTASWRGSGSRSSARRSAPTSPTRSSRRPRSGSRSSRPNASGSPS